MVDSWWCNAAASDGVVVVCHSILTSVMSTTSFLLCTKHYVVVSGVGVAMYGVATYSHVYMCFEQYRLMVIASVQLSTLCASSVVHHCIHYG